MNDQQTDEAVTDTVEIEAVDAEIVPQAYVFARTPEQNAREWAAVNAHQERTQTELAAYRREIEEETVGKKVARDTTFSAEIASTFKLFIRVPRRGRARRWHVPDPEGLQKKLEDLIDEYEHDLDDIEHDALTKLSKRAFQMGVTA